MVLLEVSLEYVEVQMMILSQEEMAQEMLLVDLKYAQVPVEFLFVAKQYSAEVETQRLKPFLENPFFALENPLFVFDYLQE